MIACHCFRDGVIAIGVFGVGVIVGQVIWLVVQRVRRR